MFSKAEVLVFLCGVRDSAPVEMMLSAKDAASTLALDFIRKYAKSAWLGRVGVFSVLYKEINVCNQR